MADIKKMLFDVYNGKCAFCEQKVEASHVEHFRPKSIYYWLAFAWSNLLFACFYCNLFKRDRFEIAGNRAVFDPNKINEINTLSASYDVVEQPRLINPEKEDAEGLFAFQKDGLILPSGTRGTYTIETCKIDRNYLNDRRKELWDNFTNDIQSEVLEGKTKEEVAQDIMVLVRKFKRESENTKLEFLAFRRYALRYFLTDLLCDILTPAA